MPEITFEDLQLSEGMLATIADLGYEAPTPIQEQTIPLLHRGAKYHSAGTNGHRQDCRLRHPDGRVHGA